MYLFMPLLPHLLKLDGYCLMYINDAINTQLLTLFFLQYIHGRSAGLRDIIYSKENLKVKQRSLWINSDYCLAYINYIKEHNSILYIL